MKNKPVQKEGCNHNWRKTGVYEWYCNRCKCKTYTEENAEPLKEVSDTGCKDEYKKGYDDGVYACRNGLEKCPRHLTSLRCIDCIEELRIPTTPEKPQSECKHVDIKGYCYKCGEPTQDSWQQLDAYLVERITENKSTEYPIHIVINNIRSIIKNLISKELKQLNADWNFKYLPKELQAERERIIEVVYKKWVSTSSDLAFSEWLLSELDSQEDKNG